MFLSFIQTYILKFLEEKHRSSFVVLLDHKD